MESLGIVMFHNVIMMLCIGNNRRNIYLHPRMLCFLPHQAPLAMDYLQPILIQITLMWHFKMGCYYNWSITVSHHFLFFYAIYYLILLKSIEVYKLLFTSTFISPSKNKSLTICALDVFIFFFQNKNLDVVS